MDLININIYFFFRFQRLSYVVDSLFVVCCVYSTTADENKINEIKSKNLFLFFFYFFSHPIKVSEPTPNSFIDRSSVPLKRKKKARGSTICKNMQIWRRDGAEWRRRRVAVNEFYEVLDRRQFPHTLKMRPKRTIFLLNLKKKTKKNSVWARRESRRPWLVAYRSSFFFIAKNRRDSTIDVVIEEQKGIAANERKRPPIAKKKKRKTTKNRSATVDWLLTGGREPIAVRPLLSTDILYFLLHSLFFLSLVFFCCDRFLGVSHVPFFFLSFPSSVCVFLTIVDDVLSDVSLDELGRWHGFFFLDFYWTFFIPDSVSYDWLLFCSILYLLIIIILIDSLWSVWIIFYLSVKSKPIQRKWGRDRFLRNNFSGFLENDRFGVVIGFLKK